MNRRTRKETRCRTHYNPTESDIQNNRRIVKRAGEILTALGCVQWVLIHAKTNPEPCIDCIDGDKQVCAELILLMEEGE